VPQYSPERRTALVLCGTGVHGAYHAGVLRALQEAGVKIDIMAGQGVGAAGAALAAVDGAARLSDANGIWLSPRISTLYRWKWPLRAAAWLCALLAPVLVTAALAGEYVPLIVPRVAALGWLALAALFCGVVALSEWRASSRRRSRGGWPWRIAGAPIDAEAARDMFMDAVWQLIHGAADVNRPSRAALGRRYSDVLAENIGHPGFRELVLVATDMDARRDVVAALLREPYRTRFMAARPGGERQPDVLDLAGVDGVQSMDFVAAALTPPVGCDPHLLTFAPDGFWRGETHRMCDRPGAISRLLEELAMAGASQAIVVSAVAPGSAPHRLMAARLDLRHRLGDALAASEGASLRDAMEMARLRFDSVYLICPSHNPVGPFDLSGAYDEGSDRRQDVPELVQRAYEDAYRQFIEPVVGASGERLAAVHDEPGDPLEGILADADPRR
jgi:hypothetical protein